MLSDYGFGRSIIPALAWRDWGKPWKRQSWRI